MGARGRSKISVDTKKKELIGNSERRNRLSPERQAAARERA